MTNAIGIDLGTTYSCVGVYENERVEIIANDQGNRTMPSYVAFTDNERFIGEAAKYQSAGNYKNTIFDAKRLIGRRFTDPEVQADIKHWPFKVMNGKGGTPHIQVQYKGETKTFTPEEVSSMVLTKIKETAENYLGEEVESAVISVPVYFNDSQRQATKDAGAIAGLDVLNIINEPTAAALAYGLERPCDHPRNVLIFDIGGGTFDVALLTLDESVFEVKATAGDTHLGGEDFDSRLLDYALEEFKRRSSEDISGDERAVLRLRTACERVKRTLSTNIHTTIEVDGLHGGIDFQMAITRARFEDLCADLFLRTITPLDDVFETSQMDASSVNEVVLVGGSTRIPKIRKMLSDYFSGKKLNYSINPDEAVAHGATIRAAMMTCGISTQMESLVLIDVTPLTLGIQVQGDIMSVVVPRNTTIPTKKSETFTTAVDDQTSVAILVFEGERSMTADNHLLGKFNLDQISPAPRGTPQIEVTFEHDNNSILHVSAVDKTPGNIGRHESITITKGRGRLTKNEIDRLMAEAETYKDVDEAAKSCAIARNEVETYAYRLRRKLEQEKGEGSFLSRLEKKKFNKAVRRTFMWMEENGTATLEDYNAKMEELKEIGNRVLA